MKIKTQEISLSILKRKEIRLFIKRIDLIHRYVSGNKRYKLKYNFIEAHNKQALSILTFGGAYSNHISATSFLAREEGIKSIGVIRGEESNILNPTLDFASKLGMELYYVSRKNYRLKYNDSFLDKLRKKFGNFYLIPEGGSNRLAVKGCSEILEGNDSQDYICCPVGTGSTLVGIVNSTNTNQHVIGFSALKGLVDLQDNIKCYLNKQNYILARQYSFGGYAKLTDELISFIGDFYFKTGIPLDAIYTGKMMMGILDLIKKDYFPKGSKILAIHTGGLQGNMGLNARFGLSLPTI